MHCSGQAPSLQSRHVLPLHEHDTEAAALVTSSVQRFVEYLFEQHPLSQSAHILNWVCLVLESLETGRLISNYHRCRQPNPVMPTKPQLNAGARHDNLDAKLECQSDSMSHSVR